MTGGAFASEARDFVSRAPVVCLDKPFTLEALRAALSGAGGTSGPHGREPA